MCDCDWHHLPTAQQWHEWELDDRSVFWGHPHYAPPGD